MLSSDVPYEDDLAHLEPDYVVIFLPRATVTQTSAHRDFAGRSRRLIVRLFRAQPDNERHALLYGAQSSAAWDTEEFANLLSDRTLHQTRFRWCNVGVRSPISGLGSRNVVRICSTMKLWNGPPERSTRCSCVEHAPLSEFSDLGVKAARRLETR